MSVLEDNGKLVVAIMDGTRKVRLGNRSSVSKKKAGQW